MKVSASIKSNINHHEVVVQSDEAAKSLPISPKASGYGSFVNGSELLLLSLATSFSNNVYRNAGKRNIAVSGARVLLKGEFSTEGELGTNFSYRAKVSSDTPDDELQGPTASTDWAAVIHKTLKKGVSLVIQEEAQSLE